ncbi:conserved hypothetical protein [Histoplasma capsulatum var. duboisii H88]|uniref:Uncharacterized protein n=1 Tax=Ajellomyces capsulatus (strain H88) TaxID=544711 RepID=F0UUB6_AJEC8|nr:conserved hypothetical protein [Histoplasma capsulatum var. duboisii H88]QSS57672.1 hypothetical protein I7I53_11937 [Histoplasma capsulatum var. duboisii H88]
MSASISNTDCERVVALLTEVSVNTSVPRTCETDLGPIQDRLSKVLDALASLLVSRPTKEVIAVGLQAGSSSNLCYTLTLASNESVTRTTVGHCRRIMKHLKQLGLEFYTLRKNTCHQTALKDMEGERADSSDMDETKFPESLRLMVDSFKADLHKFSMPKFQQRLNKKCGLTTRGAAFHSYVTEIPERDCPIVRRLKDINRILSWVTNILQEHRWEIPENKRDIFLEGMDRISDIVREVFETSNWKVKLANVASAPPFPLEGFLRKISSIPNAIETLIKCAYSPRLYRRFLFEQELEVKSLRNQPRNIKLPPSNQWMEISKQVLANSATDRSLQEEENEENEENGKEANLPGHSLSLKLSGMDVIRAPVHCECVLALKFLGENRTVRSVQYIGVSKLSCIGCWAFLKALRDNGIAFYTKGSHSKAYFPWKFPDLEMDWAMVPNESQTRITMSFFNNMSQIYAQRLREQKMMRKLSDSTTGSSSGTQRAWRFTMEDFI